MADIALVHDCDAERSYPNPNDGPFRDTWLDEDNSGTNYGGSGTAFAGVALPDLKEGIGGRAHALFYYDLNAFLPADAIIDSATLYVYKASSIGLIAENYWLARVDWGTYPWVQDEATWDDYKTAAAWGVPGGNFTTPIIDLGIGHVFGAGFTSFTVTTLATDAWGLRSGICTFGLYRNDGVMDQIGYVEFITAVPDWLHGGQHHLRINYHLQGKTFQVTVK